MKRLSKETITTIVRCTINKYRLGYITDNEIDISADNDYVTLKPISFENRFMPYAAKKILKSCPSVNWVHFTGGAIENVYSRETLKWAGIWK